MKAVLVAKTPLLRESLIFPEESGTLSALHVPVHHVLGLCSLLRVALPA